MKKNTIFCMITAFLLLGLSVRGFSQNAKDRDLIAESKEAKAQFIKTDNLMQSLFDNSYGYVIFPNIGKGAIGVGGAAGNGIVFPAGMNKP